MYSGLSNKRGGARKNVRNEINMEVLISVCSREFFGIYYVTNSIGGRFLKN